MRKIKFINNEEEMKIFKDAMDMSTIRNINNILEDVTLQKKYTKKYPNKLYLGLIDAQRKKYEEIVKLTIHITGLQNELEKKLKEAKEYIICSKN